MANRVHKISKQLKQLIKSGVGSFGPAAGKGKNGTTTVVRILAKPSNSTSLQGLAKPSLLPLVPSTPLLHVSGKKLGEKNRTKTINRRYQYNQAALQSLCNDITSPNAIRKQREIDNVIDSLDYHFPRQFERLVQAKMDVSANDFLEYYEPLFCAIARSPLLQFVPAIEKKTFDEKLDEIREAAMRNEYISPEIVRSFYSLLFKWGRAAEIFLSTGMNNELSPAHKTEITAMFSGVKFPERSAFKFSEDQVSQFWTDCRKTAKNFLSTQNPSKMLFFNFVAVSLFCGTLESLLLFPILLVSNLRAIMSKEE